MSAVGLRSIAYASYANTVITMRPGPQMIELQAWFPDAWRRVRPLFPWATTAQNSRNANTVKSWVAL